MSKRRKIYLVCLTPLLLTLPACIKNPSLSTTSSQPRTLRWATSTPPENRDWTECATERCFRHAALTMEGLTRFDVQSPLPRTVAALAADVRQVSEREWVVDLRRGLKWTDGKDLHPRDFVESWKRVLTHCRKIPASRLLFPILNAEAFCRRKVPFSQVGLDIRSPLQFVIRLARPAPFLARALAHPVTWPRRTDTNETVPTLGPFVADTEDPRTYRANPQYYAGPPGMESIVFLNSPSMEERIGLYREHSADVVEDIDDTTAARLGTDPDLQWVGNGTRVYLLLSPTRPIQSVTARRALIAAIDRKEISGLLRLPLLPVYSLNRELELEPSTPTSPPASSKALNEKSDTQPSLTWEKSSHLELVANALRAQWAKTSGSSVDLRSGTGGALRLVTWSESWFEPELPPFVPSRLPSWEKTQEKWVDQDPRVCPLFERAKGLLKSPRLRSLTPHPVGGWNFASLLWG